MNSTEPSLSVPAKKGWGGVIAIFAVSAFLIALCVIDVLYLNRYWSLFATIPNSVYGVGAILGALAGWYWAHRISRGQSIVSLFAALSLSIAAVAIVIAWVPRLDQWMSEPIAVAYQFTDRAVYRRVQSPNDERHPSYFLLRQQDVKVYDQFVVMVIDGKLGTYVNFSTLIPLGTR